MNAVEFLVFNIACIKFLGKNLKFWKFIFLVSVCLWMSGCMQFGVQTVIVTNNVEREDGVVSLHGVIGELLSAFGGDCVDVGQENIKKFRCEINDGTSLNISSHSDPDNDASTVFVVSELPIGIWLSLNRETAEMNISPAFYFVEDFIISSHEAVVVSAERQISEVGNFNLLNE